MAEEALIELRKRRIAVTGGGGFLGRHVIKLLEERGCEKVYAPSRSQYDLRHETQVEKFYKDLRPEIVLHLAAVVGGIGANRENPGSYLFENLIMGAVLLEQARLFGVEKFLTVGTVCAYPKFAPVPFKEEDLWTGYPEETNAPYGLAKKMLLVQSQAYRRQYGMNAVYLLPVNLYGPWDNFDLESSHVIPALIRKCLEAKDSGATEIVCWGDGTATREFLYVDDCAEAILKATERYNGEDPVNVGSGVEISIEDLANMISKLTGFNGRIVWDRTKPNGQPRRCLDIQRAWDRFGFQANVSLETGLARTITWYEDFRNR